MAEPPYRVQAFNSATHSENRMHDDAVAQKYGFSGGLVPGVDVFAYMVHVPVAKWGRAFLERGLMESRSNNAWERLGSQSQETPSAAYGRLRREMIKAERHVFKIARNEGRIPEEVLVRAQRELDLEESQLQRSEH